MRLIISVLLLIIISFVISYAQDQQDEFEKAAQKYATSGDKNMEAYYYNKLGYLYWDKGLSSKAIEYFEKSLILNTKSGNQNAIRELNSNIGLIYAEEEKHSSAIEYFKKALQLSISQKNNRNIASLYINIATSLQALDKHRDAISNLEKGLELALELDEKNLIMNCYAMLAQSNEAIGNSDETMKYYNLFSSVDRSIKNEKIKEIQSQTKVAIEKANEDRINTEKALNTTTSQLKITLDSLDYVEQINKKKQMEIEIQQLTISQNESQLRNERMLRYFLIGIFILIGLFSGILFYQIKQIKKANFLLAEKNEKINRQNQQINDSIQYALTIQEAILPLNENIQKVFDSFIIYRPKDVVSGDFYWFHHSVDESNIEKTLVAAVDCTGHGVPGAFMSMIGNSLLSEIINVRKIEDPTQILHMLNEEVRYALKQDKRDNRDGMDIALCEITHYSDGTKKMFFAGAKRPLYFFNSKLSEIQVLEGTHKSIGGKSIGENISQFNEVEMPVQKGDIIYMCSDGIIDQCSPDRKRFGTPRLLDFIRNNNQLSMEVQKNKLIEIFDAYRNGEEQRDDILFMGLKII